MSSDAYRFGVRGAWLTLLGIALSGPLAVACVAASHPQPPWRDALTFARHHHPIQLAPYLGGLLLVAGLVMLLASAFATMREERPARAAAGLVSTAVFAALIAFNYVLQVAFVPALARPFEATNAALLAAFSMTNPRSLAWAVEMWGWAALGVATWLAAPAFARSALDRAAAGLFVANGWLSVAGALWTVARPGWVMEPAGLIAFALWNALLTALALLALLALRAGSIRAGSLPLAGARDSLAA